MDAAWLDAPGTAEQLPYARLTQEVKAVLTDPGVVVPPRLVQPLPGGASLFVMPAHDERVAITKLITFTPANAAAGRPTILGDVIVFDVKTGERRLVLDGPTVTARRTAAVSLLAAQQLAPEPRGPLLIVGAGAQGRSHLDAFAAGLPISRVFIASRSERSAQALAAHAGTIGLEAEVVPDPSAALAACPLVVTCTPARGIVLRGEPRSDAFIAAVGAFTPSMVELDPALCRDIAARGTIAVDTPDAVHEAGDLIQAGLAIAGRPTLRDTLQPGLRKAEGPVLFKSCGWAGWDLAAARAAWPGA